MGEIGEACIGVVRSVKELTSGGGAWRWEQALEAVRVCSWCRGCWGFAVHDRVDKLGADEGGWAVGRHGSVEAVGSKGDGIGIGIGICIGIGT